VSLRQHIYRFPVIEFVEPPAADLPGGRVFTGSRGVRLGDASPGGRLRLDALVRYLQDVSDDDTTAAGLPAGGAWVVRRTAVLVDSFPRYLERLQLATWCSGVGSAWAERRIEVRGGAGGRVSATTLWVHLDGSTGRPTRLPATFTSIYGPSAQGRSVSSRLTLAACSSPEQAERQATIPWQLRFADFDVQGHVNNAAYWAVVEELLATRRSLRAPLTAVLEHVRPVTPGTSVEVCVVDMPPDPAGGGCAAWIHDGDGVAAALTVRAGPSPARR
jgi:acyl-ACP thioesterase